MDENAIPFGQWLKKQRRLLDLTQAELAQRVGCALITIRKLESGERRPSKQIASQIAAIFSIPNNERALFISYARTNFTFIRSNDPQKYTPSFQFQNPWRVPERLATNHNLPIPLTSFIGRERDISEIKQAIADQRLVTLTGPGGVGKTRLALQIAADLLEHFSGGIWFVELAPLRDSDLIPQTILSAAKMQIQPGKTGLETLVDFLREKNSLLILDNCEHMIDACAELSETLLSSAPKLKILSSSREPLGILGEQAWQVPPLSTPDIKNDPPVKQLTHYEAVRMFIDRALQVQPHFTIAVENAPAIAKICSSLEGIPLAIELAAARLRTFSPEQIASRLDNQFQLLIGGSRTALPRHQSLRALIDWSYSLLSENERKLFQRLSVFTHGWTMEAAESVCADAGQRCIPSWEIPILLEQLIEKSIVTVDHQQGQAARYHLLENMRQYGWEKLEETGEGETVRDKHLGYFLEFAEEAEPHLFRSEQLDWLDRLEHDHDNLRAGLEWALNGEHHDLLEASLRLANALWWFWNVRGYEIEGREWFRRILEKPEHPPCTVARARALGLAGYFEYRVGLEIASRLIDESLAMCQELGDRSGVAFALCMKGNITAYPSNDYPAANALLTESVSIYQDLDNKWGCAYANYILGISLFNQPDIPSAQRCWEKSLNLHREIGERRGISYALNNLGLNAADQGEMSVARMYIEESLSLSRELGDKRGMMMWLGNLGIIVLNQGDRQLAQKFAEESFDRAQELGDRAQIARKLIILGWVARDQGNYEQAGRLYTESLNTSRELDDKENISLALCNLGELARLQGNYASAHSFNSEGLKLALENNLRSIIESLMRESAALCSSQHRLKRAARLFGAAEALRNSIRKSLLTIERAEHKRNIADAQSRLEEAAFAAAWAEGLAMTMEQAVKYALEG